MSAPGHFPPFRGARHGTERERCLGRKDPHRDRGAAGTGRPAEGSAAASAGTGSRPLPPRGGPTSLRTVSRTGRSGGRVGGSTRAVGAGGRPQGGEAARNRCDGRRFVGGAGKGDGGTARTQPGGVSRVEEAGEGSRSRQPDRAGNASSATRLAEGGRAEEEGSLVRST